MNPGLPRWHYASRWPAKETPRPAADITELGTQFILAEGAEKQRLSLELLRAFHVYMAKYLDMIQRGHLPRYGSFGINEDARRLLLFLLPRGTPANKQTLIHACKHLHLAFKGNEAAEIYDVLATMLLQVISNSQERPGGMYPRRVSRVPGCA